MAAPWWTRSGYIEQVRDIAPGGGTPGSLKDRDGELAELSAFCAGDDTYLWWKAEPWAGKSALLATFVLNPPPDVEVVAFFITARLSDQSDSSALTDALIDQLGAIVGESAPVSLSPAARDAHRRALLRAASEQVGAEGRRLVLVIDGLDEDRGGQPGSGLPSVASLLPKVCGDHLRIVVAGRPDRPLPGDVPADHPLRTSGRVQRLTPSPYAAEIADRAGRELSELLHSDEAAPRDVLGLITASGGGLTRTELEELTGLAPYQAAKAVRRRIRAYGGQSRRPWDHGRTAVPVRSRHAARLGDRKLRRVAPSLSGTGTQLGRPLRRRGLARVHAAISPAWIRFDAARHRRRRAVDRPGDEPGPTAAHDQPGRGRQHHARRDPDGPGSVARRAHTRPARSRRLLHPARGSRIPISECSSGPAGGVGGTRPAGPSRGARPGDHVGMAGSDAPRPHSRPRRHRARACTSTRRQGLGHHVHRPRRRPAAGRGVGGARPHRQSSRPAAARADRDRRGIGPDR
jgi:hypothetical protein